MESAKSRRMSVGTKELGLEKMKWDLAHDCVEDAKEHWKNGQVGAATKKCEKALELCPSFFPAAELKKAIEKGDLSVLDSTDYSHDDSEDWADKTGERGFYEPDITLGFAADTEDSVLQPRATQRQPCRETNVQERKPTWVPEAKKSHDVRFTFQKPAIKQVRFESSSSSSAAVQPSGRSTSVRPVPFKSFEPTWEQDVQELLLSGHYGRKSPLDVLNGLNSLLWSVHHSAFICPAKNCKSKFKTRQDCTLHYTNIHFGEDSDKRRIRPFFCKDCGDTYRNVRALIEHAAISHPIARWLPPLQDAVKPDMK